MDAPRSTPSSRASPPPLGYIELTALLWNARAVLTDSGRAAEGGVHRRRSVRNAAAEHGVDGDHRRGLEHARRPRSRTPRWRRSAHRRPPSARALWRRRGRATRHRRSYTAVRMRRAHGSDRCRRSRILGAEPRAEFRGARRRRARWCCDPVASARSGPAAAHPGRARPRATSTTCSPTRPRRDRARDAGSDPRRARGAGPEAGKHCFVEKPLAQSVAEAERAVAPPRGRPRGR